MPGACECSDEASKDVKCCICLDSYCWFKVLAWFNLIFMGILTLMLSAAVGFMGYVADCVEKGEGKIKMPDGKEFDVKDITQEDLDKLQEGMGAVVISFIFCLYSFTATVAFVCCDSARSR